MRPALVASILLAGTLAVHAAQQQVAFVPFEAPALLRCGAGDVPYFRATINAVDLQNNPVGVTLGSGRNKGFEVFEEGRQAPHPVLFVTEAGTAVGSAGNYVLLLLDTSGSMQQRLPSRTTRFNAATAAIKESLSTFVEGTDHIAVAPFESHQVVPRIEAAVFRGTKAELAKDVDGIRRPQGNTALYSAIVTALPMLERQRNTGATVALVVFSDGENDIQRGDDPGLLTGEADFAKARDQIKRAGVPVFTVGFGAIGNKSLIAELQGLAFPGPENFYDAQTDPQKLSSILQAVRQKQASRIQLLFGPVRPNRQDLRAADLSLSVRLTGPGGTTNSRVPMRWSAGHAADPVANADCTTAEAEALVGGDQPLLPTQSPWQPFMIFTMYAVIIAGLWFAAPRFVWPDAYIARPVVPQLPSTPLPPGVQAPPQPRVPTWDEMKRAGGPPQPPPARDAVAPARGGEMPPRGRPDQTVVVPPRSTARTPSPPRRGPSGHTDDPPDAEATVIVPKGPRQPR